MAWWGWLVLVWLPVSVFTAGWMAHAIHAAEMGERTVWYAGRRAGRSATASDATGPRLGSSDRGGDGSSLGVAS